MRPGPTSQNSRCSLDVRVGGRFTIEMIGDGKTYHHTGEYLEIRRPERLVFTWISAGTNERPSVVTVEFIAQKEGTEIVLTHQGLPTDASTKAHTAGWTALLATLSGIATK
jgi:uncharacterized protein YndB with AHSA1/START domain